MLNSVVYSEAKVVIPPYKFLVEYIARYDDTGRILSAKFTNEVHAKNFARRQKQDGLKGIKLYLITSKGTRGKEIRFR